MRGLGVSLLLHAAAGLLLSVWARPLPARREPEPIAISLSPVPPPPPAPAPAPPPPPAPAPAPPPAPRASTRGLRPGTAPPPRAPSREPPPTGNPAMLSMRPPASAVADPSQPPRPGDILVPSPADALRPPGAPPQSELPPGAFLGPARAPKPFVPSGDPTGRELGHGVVADGNGGYREDRPGYASRIDRDGSIHFKDKGNVGVDSVGASDMGATIFGHFDLTDAVMRALGDDPYAYEKMKIMDETREVRAGMSLRDRSDRFREAQRKLGGYLEKIWAHGGWTVAQKRRIYFALWEEAAEDGDPEMRRAGIMARATIEAFVRRRLPEGGADAYTSEELVELNRARKSRKKFEPYAR